ncbi:MAG: MFS transporter [Fervidobacterium sp.]
MVTLDNVIEEKIAPSYQKKMLWLTSLIWMFDAAGVLVLSFTLPSISKEWNIDISASANIISSTFLGMLIGALSVGFVSDIFGRKVSNVLYFLFTIVFTTLLGFTTNSITFTMFRLLAGIGYGGLMPSVNAYLAEFTGKELRGAYLVLLEASWAIGSIIIGLVAVLTVNISWRISYYAFLSGFLFLPVLIKLPESPRFIFKKYGRTNLEKAFSISINDTIEQIPSSKVGIIDILRGPYLKKTVMIWVQWFTVSFVYYTLFSWAPKIFATQGISATKSLWFTFFMMVAQLPGYLSAAYSIEKIGRKKSMVVYTIGMGISAILWAFVSSTFQLIFIALLLSFFTLGVWGLVYAYTPELYPTTMRGTGNGMAGVIARIAGILAPQYGGFMLANNRPLIEIFGYLSLLSFIAMIVVATMGVETKQKEIF